MISCYHLTVPGAERTGPIFEDISFEIGEGEWVEFVGPSGAGKSVLYSILALETRPADGRIVVAGRNLARLDGRGLIELRREIGTCRESVELLEDRSVVENMVVPLVVRDKVSRAADAADRLLERAGLSSLRDVSVSQLSHGERRLVALLRAVIGRPRAILIDGGLEVFDGELLEIAREALQRSHAQGTAVYLFSRQPTDGSGDGRTVYYIDGAALCRQEP